MGWHTGGKYAKLKPSHQSVLPHPNSMQRDKFRCISNNREFISITLPIHMRIVLVSFEFSGARLSLFDATWWGGDGNMKMASREIIIQETKLIECRNSKTVHGTSHKSQAPSLTFVAFRMMIALGATVAFCATATGIESAAQNLSFRLGMTAPFER